MGFHFLRRIQNMDTPGSFISSAVHVAKKMRTCHNECIHQYSTGYVLLSTKNVIPVAI